jgi:hypothetical protein
MKALPLFTLVVAGQALAQTVVEPQVPAAEELYVLSTKSVPAGGGKAIDINFREIKREPDLRSSKSALLQARTGPHGSLCFEVCAG